MNDELTQPGCVILNLAGREVAEAVDRCMRIARAEQLAAKLEAIQAYCLCRNQTNYEYMMQHSWSEIARADDIPFTVMTSVMARGD